MVTGVQRTVGWCETAEGNCGTRLGAAVFKLLVRMEYGQE